MIPRCFYYARLPSERLQITVPFLCLSVRFNHTVQLAAVELLYFFSFALFHLLKIRGCQSGDEMCFIDSAGLESL